MVRAHTRKGCLDLVKFELRSVTGSEAHLNIAAISVSWKKISRVRIVVELHLSSSAKLNCICTTHIRSRLDWLLLSLQPVVTSEPFKHGFREVVFDII